MEIYLKAVGNVKVEAKQKEEKNWHKSGAEAYEDILEVRFLGKTQFSSSRFGWCAEIWAEAKNETWGPAAPPGRLNHQGGDRGLW